jgi:hypothetical protein
LNTAIKLLRAAGVFVVNFAAATVATNFFSNDVSHIYRAKTLAGMLHREWFVGALFAAGLGYFVFFKWRSPTAKWVWLAGSGSPRFCRSLGVLA